MRITVALLLYAAALPACAQPLPPIHVASRAGDSARVRALLAEDPRLVNTAERKGWTPLHFAAQEGHVEVAEILLARGADANARLIVTGGTPLHVAASTGATSVASLLLRHGAAVDAPDLNGWTPLHRAAEQGHRQVVELLVANGASVHSWSSANVTPIEAAEDAGYRGLAAYLRARPRILLPFATDFSASCPWATGETMEFAFGCEQGAYRMHIKRAGPVHVVQNFGLAATAVSAAVDAHVASGRSLEAGALLGVGCMTERWRGYVGVVATRGAWGVMRVKRMKFNQLAGSNESQLAGRLRQVNRLRLDCVAAPGGETAVSLYLNGQRIAAVRDREGLDRFNGFALYTDAFPGDVVFDDFAASSAVELRRPRRSPPPPPRRPPEPDGPPPLAMDARLAVTDGAHARTDASERAILPGSGGLARMECAAVDANESVSRDLLAQGIRARHPEYSDDE